MREEKPPEPTSVPQQPDEKKSGSKGWVIARLLGLAGLIFLFAGRGEGTAQYGLWFLAFGVIGIVVVLITTPGYKPREIPSQGCLLAILLGFAGLIFLRVRTLGRGGRRLGFVKSSDLLASPTNLAPAGCRNRLGIFPSETSE